MEIQSRPELAFDEQQHLYTLGGLVLPSVTQIMSPMSSMLYAAVPQAALDAAADRGTRAHEQVNNYVRYGVLETDEDTAPYVRAFLRFCKDYSPTWQGSEIRTYHRQMMYAGTLDLLGHIEPDDGQGVDVVDLKCTAAYHSVMLATQIGAYAHAMQSHGMRIRRLYGLQLMRDGRYHFGQVDDGYKNFFALHGDLQRDAGGNQIGVIYMEARATDNVLQIRTLGSLGIEEQLTASGQAIIERAENMRIGNAREYEDAAAFLVEIKKRSKQMKEYWKPSKDAAKAAHARICEQEKAMLAPMERAEKTIKAGMARYQTAEAEARREAERKAVKRQQIERDRLMNEAAEAEQARDMHGAAISMAMAEMVEDMKASVLVAEPAKAVSTTVSKRWKARVVDEAAVPAYVNGMELRKINQTALDALARMSKGEASIGR